MYTELTITVTDTLQKEMLIAQLSALGADGFEEDGNLLKTFISSAGFDKKEAENIISGYQLSYTSKTLENRNWNQEWESNFQPVVIDQFCAVRADFHESVPGVQYDIIVTPKMSFGTGHHATTWLMIKAMGQLDFKNSTVFDFGTGTGILAILAEKMGAATITAVDNDSWSIENSKENFNRNKCHNILLINDHYIFGETPYDIILANINRSILRENMGKIKQHLAVSGVLLLSGLLTGDESIIMEEAIKQRLKLDKRLEKDGWICLQLIHD